MTVLLIGMTLLLAVHYLVKGSGKGSGAVWVLPLGVLVVGQIWIQRDRLEGYQLRVLGQRFRIEADSVGLGPAISGDQSQSDIYVSGAGATPVAYLEAEVNGGLALVVGEGHQAVVLVGDPGGLRPGWTLLRSVAVVHGDRIQVGAEGAPRSAWTFVRDRETTLERLHLGGTRDRLVAAGPREAAEVIVPYPVESGLWGLFPSRPGVLQRTYPLADLLAEPMGGVPGLAALRSFLYYKNGEPRLAVLDPDIRVVSDDGPRSPILSLSLGSDPGPLSSFSLAGLPHRDFPDPRLASAERYGVRPLRSFRARMDGAWVSLAGPRPQILSLPLLDWEGPLHGATPSSDPTYPVRLATGGADAASGAVRLVGLSDRFDAASQAVLRLPESPSEGTFELLSPAGIARWRTGQPFTLGDGDRGLLLRVDGLTASGSFLALLAVLFALAALPFATFAVGGRVKALAVAALGFGSLRVLLSLSAMARYPFVDEGHHISLWLIPALPWFVCTVGWLWAGPGSEVSAEPVAVVPRGFSGGYMGAVGEGSPTLWRRWTARLPTSDTSALFLAAASGAVLVFLATVLFSASPPKSVALGILTAVLAMSLLVRDRLMDWASRVFGTASRLGALGWPGAIAGVSLLFLRIVLELVGFREQISVAGTRIGLSVLYTPVVVAAFALVLWVHMERVNRGSHAEARRSAAAAWVDLGVFLVSAFVGVSLWISDFGIALTTLLGPMVALAAVGWSWSRRLGPGAALGGSIPLLLFVTLQLSPGLVHPGLAGDADRATRLDEWSRNELLLLERGDPDLLRLIGESRSEALAVMRETMRSYTRGNWTGRGFLAGRVSPEIRNTAVREHAAGGLVASQWGAVGAVGLVMMLLACLAPFLPDLPGRGSEGRQGPAPGWWAGAAAFPCAAVMIPAPGNLAVVAALTAVVGVGAILPLLPETPMGLGPRLWPPGAADSEWTTYRPSSPGWLVGATAAATLGLAGIYMVLANYGLVLFTGKNIYLLGLDSVGDTLEALALLTMAAAGLSASERESRVVRPLLESELRAVPETEPSRLGWRRVG